MTLQNLPLSSSITHRDGSGSAVSDTRGLETSVLILAGGGGTASFFGRGKGLSWGSCGTVPPPASPALHWSLARLRVCCVGQPIHPAGLAGLLCAATHPQRMPGMGSERIQLDEVVVHLSFSEDQQP